MKAVPEMAAKDICLSGFALCKMNQLNINENISLWLSDYFMAPFDHVWINEYIYGKQDPDSI